MTSTHDRALTAAMPASNGHAPLGACTMRLTPEESAFLDLCLSELTTRERDVVRALCLGGGNEALADRLCVALPTLRTHLMRINQKLGSTGKDDIVRYVASRLLDAHRSGTLASGRADRPGGRSAVIEAKGAQGGRADHR